ncbi:MAG TPA: efflux RND transporter periplasmic adaptor subunit [Burkholderiaceae bacterium]|nr:efflux RND transporter periplasmic adaptor subunit [Burkholderiaceae bacterium]
MRSLLLALPVLFLAVACQRAAPVSEDVRPIRALTVQPRTTTALAEFAGEVRPRIETRAGFQVPGRVTQRLVEVGQSVKAGQPLASIDAQDYRLAAEAAGAGLTAAQVDRDQQRADYRRFQDLQTKGFISQADLDRRKAALDAAEARYLQAQASAQSSGNQAAYSVLRAPHDAIVTGVDAEVGQVVTAGQSVIRLARTGEKEVMIGIPEQQLALLQSASAITVRMWSGGEPIAGRMREVSPAADPTTRTFPARVALVNPPPTVALGMTATVSFATPMTSPVLAVPLQALQAEGGVTHAWVFDPGTQTVRRTRVRVDNVAGNEIVIGEGLKPGDIVVTAGVHQLKEGQKVRLLSEATQLAPAQATVKPETLKKS